MADSKVHDGGDGSRFNHETDHATGATPPLRVVGLLQHRHTGASVSRRNRAQPHPAPTAKSVAHNFGSTRNRGRAVANANGTFGALGGAEGASGAQASRTAGDNACDGCEVCLIGCLQPDVRRASANEATRAAAFTAVASRVRHEASRQPSGLARSAYHDATRAAWDERVRIEARVVEQRGDRNTHPRTPLASSIVAGLLRTATFRIWDAPRCFRTAMRSVRDTVLRLWIAIPSGWEATHPLRMAIPSLEDAAIRLWIAIPSGMGGDPPAPNGDPELIRPGPSLVDRDPERNGRRPTRSEWRSRA